MRKLIGMIALMLFLIAWITGAVMIGGRLSEAHWLASLVFYIVAGIGWAFPLKPLMIWMHAKDKPLPSSEV